MKLLALIIVVLLIVAGALWYEKKRSDDLARAAQRLGFSFEQGQHPLPRDLADAGFYLFSQGPALVRNPMHGRYGGRPVRVFGYSFTAAFGDEGMRELPNSDNDGLIETRMQTVVWMESQKALPDFDLAPTRGPIRNVSKRFGFAAVSFDGRQDFRAVYTLSGRDEGELRHCFSPKTLDFLTAHPGTTVEGRGHGLLLYRQEQRLTGSQIGPFLNSAAAFLAHLQNPDEPGK
jgi:hypothetical protein